MMTKKKTPSDMIWIPQLQTAEGDDFELPNGDKGYFYCTGGGWVLYVNGECLFEGYAIKDICEWLKMLSARRILKGG